MAKSVISKSVLKTIRELLESMSLEELNEIFQLVVRYVYRERLRRFKEEDRRRE